MESFSFASDLHGDRKDPAVTRAFLRFVQDFEPQVKVFGGDLWDFRALRSKATEEEKRASMRDDFGEGMRFLNEYMPHYILLGNHDVRLWDVVEKDGLKKSGPLVDYAEEKIAAFEAFAKKHRITVLPYDKRTGILELNGLKFAHGFNSSKRATADMARVYGNILFGHGHAIDEATEPGLEPKIARMVGCLCQLDMGYNRQQINTLRQQHGWAYGTLNRRNRFDVFQARVADGVVTYAESLKTLRV